MYCVSMHCLKFQWFNEKIKKLKNEKNYLEVYVTFDDRGS